MSDIPEISTDSFEIADSIVQHERRVLESFNEQLEQRILKIIRDTDWDEYEVVDVVIKGDITNPLSVGIRTFPYKRIDTPLRGDYYERGDAMKQVYSITEQKCLLAHIDPETGVKEEPPWESDDE